eukprot:8378278-Alexandrium_andersonii.AAC.1
MVPESARQLQGHCAALAQVSEAGGPPETSSGHCSAPGSRQLGLCRGVQAPFVGLRRLAMDLARGGGH